MYLQLAFSVTLAPFTKYVTIYLLIVCFCSLVVSARTINCMRKGFAFVSEINYYVSSGT